MAEKTEVKTKAQMEAELAEPEATTVFYMKEPQYHPDHGKLLPGDQVHLTAAQAKRWERLGLIYPEGDKHKGQSLRERIAEAEAAAREQVLAEAGLTAQPVMLGGDSVPPEYEAAQKETDERYARARELLDEDQRASRRASSRRVATREELAESRRVAQLSATAAGSAVLAQEAYTSDQPAEKE